MTWGQLHKDGSNEASATEMELRSVNERVVQLERQLLDAEETICHLKAEKLAALRDVERLTSVQRRDFTDESDEQCTLVAELQARLTEQNETHVLEQEQRMAVIREQEQELQTLRSELEKKTQQLQELEQRDPKAEDRDINERVENDVSQCCIYGDESDESKEENKSGSRARAPADADTVSSKWQEVLVRHPTPHFDLESPEVAYILRAWTTNMKKMRYLRRWLIQVVTTKGPLPDEFPMGVELPRLPPELRDGFLTLVLPLLRQQTEREILVHSRRYNDGFHTDLRFRLVPRD